MKDCPACNCAWFAASAADRCQSYGNHQGAVRDTATGNWHKAMTACCACEGGEKAATAAPTLAVLAPHPAVAANGGVAGCSDLSGTDAQGTVKAFHIKDCPDCGCAWLAQDNRCAAYGMYTGAVKGATGTALTGKVACCTCDGGNRQ